MNKESKNVMSKCLGCYPQLIDSAIFSAQQRPRFYWFNFGNLRKDLVGNKYYTVPLPEDRGIVLKDILEENVDEKYFYSYPLTQVDMTKQVCAIMDYKNNEMHKRIFNPEFKVHTLTCCNGGNLQKKVMINGRARKMTPLEYERCQTLPDNWTKIGKNQMGVEREQSNTARYNGCGNGWTCDVISHIFSYIPVEVLDECT